MTNNAYENIEHLVTEIKHLRELLRDVANSPIDSADPEFTKVLIDTDTWRQIMKLRKS